MTTVLDDEVIRALFRPLATADGLLLAVSGGPDSLALLVLAARWRALETSVPFMAVATVDHGLRTASREEALFVEATAASYGLPCRILSWVGDKPRNGVSERARRARYELLTRAAIDSGCSHILTAHHEGDQAETVLMRLAAGSGVAGLAAMRPELESENGVHLARPLLALPKALLIAVTQAAGLQAVDDPSNQDKRYLRGRLRAASEARQALGLTDKRLATLAARCARAETALDYLARGRFAALSGIGNVDIAQHIPPVRLAAGIWDEPDEIILRCLALAIALVVNDHGEKEKSHAAAYSPLRLMRLERLLSELRDAHDDNSAAKQRMLKSASRKTRTLGGAMITVSAGGEMMIAPEPPRKNSPFRNSSHSEKGI